MKAKILLFDIETSPNLGYVWGKYQQDVIAYKDEWKIMSVAYKWLGKPTVHSIVSDQFGLTICDKQLVHKMQQLFKEADILVAHNGDAFDIKRVKARMLVHGLKPPSNVATIDTLKVARRNFNFNSSKLGDLGKILKLGGKLKHTGFDMWLGCLNGSKKSWALLERYNKADVVLLEKIYKKMLPWINNHPNVSLLGGHKGCPKCGSEDLIKDGIRANSKTLQQQWECKKCGGKTATGLKNHGKI